ncbi:hypothetical protein F2P56_036537, partial [Juglans regia]
MSYVFTSFYEALESNVWDSLQSQPWKCEYLPFLGLSSFSLLQFVFSSHHDALESSVSGSLQSEPWKCEYLSFLGLSSFSLLRLPLAECFRCCPFSPTRYSVFFRSNFQLYDTDD